MPRSVFFFYFNNNINNLSSLALALRSPLTCALIPTRNHCHSHSFPFCFIHRLIQPAGFPALTCLQPKESMDIMFTCLQPKESMDITLNCLQPKDSMDIMLNFAPAGSSLASLLAELSEASKSKCQFIRVSINIMKS